MGIAYKSLCNNFGIIIDDIIYDFEEYVFFHFTNDAKTHKVKIYYTAKGRAFFKAGSSKYYIDEFMRA